MPCLPASPVPSLYQKGQPASWPTSFRSFSSMILTAAKPNGPSPSPWTVSSTRSISASTISGGCTRCSRRTPPRRGRCAILPPAAGVPDTARATHVCSAARSRRRLLSQAVRQPTTSLRHGRTLPSQQACPRHRPPCSRTRRVMWRGRRMCHPSRRPLVFSTMAADPYDPYQVTGERARRRTPSQGRRSNTQITRWNQNFSLPCWSPLPPPSVDFVVVFIEASAC